MKKQSRRWLSLVLCILMCVTLLPLNVFAADAEEAEVVSNATTKYRALLIGEYKFPKGVEQDGDTIALRMKNDVVNMKKLLSSVKGGKGGKYTITYKYNRTNSQIKSLIKSTFKGAKKTDVSLFFISTHGVVGEPKSSPWAGALLTTNSSGTSIDYLFLSDLAAWLKEVPGKVIVIISSCSSGSAIVNSNGGQFRVVSSAKDAANFDNAVIKAFSSADVPVNDGTAGNRGPFRKSKFYVLTASKHDELSWGYEDPDNYSKWCYNFMPYYMLQGVTGSRPADANKDNKITLKELYKYTYKKCVAECKYCGTETIQHVQVYPTNSNFVLFRK